MYIVNGKRGSGKSRSLLHIASKSGALFICRHKDHARYLTDLATAIGLNVKIVTYNDFLNGKHRGLTKKGVVVDDAIAFLEFIVTEEVRGVSLDICEGDRQFTCGDSIEDLLLKEGK